MSGPFAKIPAEVVLDASLPPLARRLFEFLDLKSGTRGYWDDSLVAIAEALQASRRHLGDAARLLEERGYITRERHGHWRTRYVVIARLAGAQMALDEHPIEVGVRPFGAGGVRPSGAGGEPIGRINAALYLSPNKEVLSKKGMHVQQKRAGDEYNRNTRTAWPA